MDIGEIFWMIDEIASRCEAENKVSVSFSKFQGKYQFRFQVTKDRIISEMVSFEPDKFESELSLCLDMIRDRIDVVISRVNGGG